MCVLFSLTLLYNAKSQSFHLLQMWSSEHLPLCLFTETTYLWCPLCQWALLCFDQLPLCYLTTSVLPLCLFTSPSWWTWLFLRELDIPDPLSHQSQQWLAKCSLRLAGPPSHVLVQCCPFRTVSQGSTGVLKRLELKCVGWTCSHW